LKIYRTIAVTESNVVLKPLKERTKEKIYETIPVTESNIILKPLKKEGMS